MSAEALSPATQLTPDQLREEVRRNRMLSLGELMVIMAYEDRHDPVPPEVKRRYDMYVDLAEEAQRQIPRP